MRRPTALLLASLIAAAPSLSAGPVLAAAEASAPSAERLALGREVVEAEGGVARYHPVLDVLAKGPHGDKMRKAFEARLPELVGRIAAVYAAEFDAEQLRGMLTFARDPAAKAVTAHRPDLLKAEGPLVAWATGAFNADTGEAVGPPPPPLPSSATPPTERLALARQVIEASGAGRMVLAAPAINAHVMLRIFEFAGMPVTAQDKAKLAAQVVTAEPRMAPFLSAVNERLAWIYASIYSDEDLSGMLTYFRSPAGHAMAERLPHFTQAVQDAILDVWAEAMKDAMKA